MNPMTSHDFMRMHHKEFQNGAVWEDLFKTLRNREALAARVLTLENGINWIISSAELLEKDATQQIEASDLKDTETIRYWSGRHKVAKRLRTMAQAVKDGRKTPYDSEIVIGVDVAQPGTEQTIIHDGKGNNV